MKNAKDVVNHLEVLVQALEGVYADAFTDNLIGQIIECLDHPEFEKFLDSNPRELVQAAVIAAYLHHILVKQRRRMH